MREGLGFLILVYSDPTGDKTPKKTSHQVVDTLAFLINVERIQIVMIFSILMPVAVEREQAASRRRG
ncbi:hypothetical protein BHU62_02925 [Serratia marcescens]|uniref:Uncharacterized protein n=1 Tax=Serratia marcescens TaxID=615 RepID=A0A1Q4P5M4_SERMA|nr:hypothetical protein [Serratia marcescens]OKB68435.1 hypothetical protein BHU62_02925 [Serratia marcescens]